MIKGNMREERMRYEEVLERTSAGYDIYMYYEGKVEKLMRCPWRKDDHKSFGISMGNDIWIWRDFATEETGTPVDFVMKKFSLSFAEALNKIIYDFGWSTKRVNANPVKITWERIEPQIIPISFSTKPFEKKHHDYWNRAGVSEIDCNKKECWAVKDLAVNRKRFYIKEDEIVFAYYSPEEDRAKIYFPEREKGSRFLNNVSFYYLWNFSNVSECKDLIVQKSVKDLIVTSVITPCVIASQAEAVKIFNDDIVEKINTISQNVWVWYGSDVDGVEKCKEITKRFHWKYINTPKKYLPDVNDTYGMACKYGLKEVEEFMKHKKFPL